jgi:hypothetical protein
VLPFVINEIYFFYISSPPRTLRALRKTGCSSWKILLLLNQTLIRRLKNADPKNVPYVYEVKRIFYVFKGYPVCHYFYNSIRLVTGPGRRLEGNRRRRAGLTGFLFYKPTYLNPGIW